MVKARLTIDQKIEVANLNPFNKDVGGKTYRLYDEAKTKEQANSWATSLLRRGYKPYIEERLIDDIMKGKWFYVYDVYFVENPDIKKELAIK